MTKEYGPAPTAIGNGAADNCDPNNHPLKRLQPKTETFYLHVACGGEEQRYNQRPQGLPILTVRRIGDLEHTATWNRAPIELDSPRRLYPVTPPGQDWEFQDTDGTSSRWRRRASKAVLS